MGAKVNKKSNTAKKIKGNIETCNIYPELRAVFDAFIENEIKDWLMSFFTSFPFRQLSNLKKKTFSERIFHKKEPICACFRFFS